MASRHAGSVYDEREYYSSREEQVRRPTVRVRERERDFEDETFIQRETQSSRRPDFLRDDYGPRAEAGPMVVRERDTEVYTTRRPRSNSPGVRIRSERIMRDRSPSMAGDMETLERVRTNLRMDRSPSPDRLRARVIETRERIPMRPRSPSPIRYERFVERERTRQRSPSLVREDRIHITERRSPSPSIRSLSPAPLPPPPIQAPPIHQEIITHHRHIDHGFERARVPTPPPPPRRVSPKVRETDIDIYTSRHNTEVDIHQKTSGGGRSRTPNPASQSLSRRNDYYDDTVIYEQEREKLRVRDDRLTMSRRRSVSARPTQSMDRDRVRVGIRENESESEFYGRKTEERAYVGEAYNGATKNWSIVDVPPGTERVRMEGVGGGAEEITWQKYNGVRRSKFIPERERESVRERELEPPRRESGTTGLEIEISSRRRQKGAVYERDYERIEESSDRRVGLPRKLKNRVGDLWTEITKDLVVKEAIEQMGYDYEETEYFYYVIQYLGYEDVLQLVTLSEKIRRDRHQRLREIERERLRLEKRAREREEWERMERRRSRHAGFDDERIVERETIYDRGAPRGSGQWR